MRNDRSRFVGLYKLYAYNYKFDVKNYEITYWISNAQY